MRTTYNIVTAVNVRFEEQIVPKDNMRVDIESQMKAIVFIILQSILQHAGFSENLGISSLRYHPVSPGEIQ